MRTETYIQTETRFSFVSTIGLGPLAEIMAEPPERLRLPCGCDTVSPFLCVKTDLVTDWCDCKCHKRVLRCQ